MQKIAPAHFKMIEHELYNYDDTVKRLELLKEQIIESGVTGENVRVQTGRISNPTLAKAIDLLTNTEVQYLSWVVRAVNTALLLLDEDHNEIYVHRYRQKKNWRQTLSEMYISQDTYFKKRRELIQMVAVQLGITKP